MEPQYKLSEVSDPITVDLNVVEKYHLATQHHKDHKEKKGLNVEAFESVFSYHKLIEVTDEGEVVHPAYDFESILEEALPLKHRHNLIYIIRAYINHEWACYQNGILDGDPNKDQYIISDSPVVPIDMLELMHEECERLWKLLTVKESSNAHITRVAIDYIEKDNDGKPIFRKGAPSKAILSADLHNQFIDYAISTSFTHIKEKFHDHSQYILQCDQVPSASQLRHSIDAYIKFNFKLERADHLFRQMLARIIYNYIYKECNNRYLTNERGETELRKEILDPIYILLATQQVIDSNIISSHTTVYDRADYVRRLIKLKEYKEEGQRDPTEYFFRLI